MRLRELIKRTLDIDGTEMVMLFLRGSPETEKYLYLWIFLEETE